MWHDLAFGKYRESIVRVKGRGFAYNHKLINIFFNRTKTGVQYKINPSSETASGIVDHEVYMRVDSELVGIVRGHQHNNAIGPMLDTLIEHHGFVDMQEQKFWPQNYSWFVCNILSACEVGCTIYYIYKTMTSFLEQFGVS